MLFPWPERLFVWLPTGLDGYYTNELQDQIRHYAPRQPSSWTSHQLRYEADAWLRAFKRIETTK